ncbi:DNA ligase [Thiohalocapsa marina]|uniref:DNA ligase n=1 Tax=Thiohalocapsa marina TaxID=424902 RepID=A0A5M8FRF5_9GAMM|nr:DNA ligase [Thiohalocapsa marina]KAA6185395.1 DNA ligase [Thiohalocapsa marina]
MTTHWTRAALSLIALGMLRAQALANAEPTDCGEGSSTRGGDCSNPVAGFRAMPPDLTLAEVYSPGVDLADYLVSEKFDGVRAYWDGTRLITRGGLVINAPAWFTDGFPDVPLDGELWMGRGSFAKVSGTARRLEPELDAWQRVRYVLFDLPRHDGPFEARAAALQELLQGHANPHLGLAEQTVVADHAALMATLERVVADGGEGLMLHRRDAPYRAGRSDHLLKVKPYLEADARVIDHLPGRGKYQGMLGSLLVEEPDGTRFRIGTGFSDAERADPPPIGSLVSFKYHGRTVNGLPRFASYLRLADPL